MLVLIGKKIGHKYYNIKRREVFIDSVKNIVYNKHNDFQCHKNKIVTFVNDIVILINSQNNYF